MVADRDKMFRRQSIITYVSVGSILAVVQWLSPPGAFVLLQGWIMLLLISTYIFATRTFRLTGDRYFLFLGAAVPGVIITKVFEILSMQEFMMLADYHYGLSTQFRNATRLFVMGVVVLAPFLSRLNVHRYLWTFISLVVGGLGAALLLFTDLVPMCIIEGTEGACGKIYVDLAICVGFSVAAVELGRSLAIGSRVGDSRINREKIRLMLVAVCLFLAASVISIFYRDRYSWLAWLDVMFRIAGWYLIVEILVHRGLELPVTMISRSRSQLEAALSAAVDGVLVNDLDGSVIAMNKRFRIFCGVGIDVESDSSVMPLLQRAIRNAVRPGFLKERVQERLQDPASEGFERFEMKDGRIIEMSSIPYMFEGRIDGRVWTFRDVSVRERTTAQLERTSWRLDNILSAAREGIFEMDIASGALWVHQNWCSVTGCDQSRVPASWEQWRRMIHPDDVALIQRELLKPHEADREYSVEFRMGDEGGGWRWFSANGRTGRVEGPDGSTTVILNGVLRDMTAEKVRDAEIRRQRGMMEALIENMPLGAFVKEIPSRRYVIWNSMLSRLSGIMPGQAQGRRDVDIFGSEIAARIRRSDDEVVSQGVSVVIENSWIGDSRGRNSRVRMVPVVDSDRTVTLIIGIVEDITQQQQIERLMHQTRSMEALGRLAGGVAHDFNNILQVIIGSADALKACPAVMESGLEDVEQILDAGDKAMGLIRQLLTFSRQDGSTRETVDFGRVVSDLLKMLTRLIGADISLNVAAPPGRYFVFAEKSRVEQVVLNLTVNAVDAMPYGGVLDVETGTMDVRDPSAAGHPRAAVGPYVFVSVRDSGIGIPGDVLDHIWEPFFSTKEIGKGTGLGLSTVYGIVESLGGFVTIGSEPGKGSEFKVFLPAYSPGRSGESLPAATVESISAPGETILLARPDPEVLERDAAALEKAGFRVLRASSGPEAMNHLLDADRSGHVDMMILDMSISGTGGRDICDRYLQDHVQIPVLFIRGVAAPVMDREYLEDIGARVIQLPYTPRQLLLEVRTLMMQSPEA